MTEEKKASMMAAGLQIDAALHRFMGNEKMVEKYLNRFLTEKSYDQLKTAIQSGDHDTAAMAAHSLKSVCGTLGFAKMQEQVIQLETLIRSGKWDDAVAMWPEVEKEDQRICGIIQS